MHAGCSTKWTQALLDLMMPTNATSRRTPADMILQKQTAKTSKYLKADGLMSWNATTLSSCAQKQKWLPNKSADGSDRIVEVRRRCTERSRGDRWWKRGHGRRCRRTRTSRPSASAPSSSPRGRGSRRISSSPPFPPIRDMVGGRQRGRRGWDWPLQCCARTRRPLSGMHTAVEVIGRELFDAWLNGGEDATGLRRGPVARLD